MVSESAGAGKRAGKTRRGLVLGCGGTLGSAWSLATLFEVSRALAWDPREAEVIYGTSAGATLAMLLGAGVSVDALLAAELGAPGADPVLAAHFASPPPKLPSPPRGGPAGLGLVARMTSGLPTVTALSGLLPEGTGDTTFLARLAEHVAPRDRDHGADSHFGRTRIVTMDAKSGRRVVFGAPGSPRASIGAAVRASWAIPGWFPSVVIGNHRYLDGGIVSPTSVDLAAAEGVDELVVIAPMTPLAKGPSGAAHALMRLLRSSMRKTLDAEVTRATAAGVRVLRLEPTAEDLEVLGPNLMDGDLRLRVIESSLRTARRNVRAALTKTSFSTGIQAYQGGLAWTA